jgi:hypothetical protein
MQLERTLCICQAGPASWLFHAWSSIATIEASAIGRATNQDWDAYAVGVDLQAKQYSSEITMMMIAIIIIIITIKILIAIITTTEKT